MKVVTLAMAEALSERGFVSRKKRWVLLRPSLPVEVSVEKDRVGPAYGISIYFGGPGFHDNADDVCLQVSQRELAGERSGFYYDFSDPEQGLRCEREFFVVTLPLLDRVAGPTDLAEGLLDGLVTPARCGDAAARPLAALRVIRAYGLSDLEPRLGQALRSAAADRVAYERMVWLVGRWPEDYVGLAELLEAVPVPHASVSHRLRGWQERRLAGYRRARHGRTSG